MTQDFFSILKGLFCGFVLTAVLGLILPVLLLGFFHYVSWLRAMFG